MGQIFEDGVLLRIRRQYSHDEAVGFISQKLSEKEVEIGVLKSEIAELKFLLKRQKKTEKRRVKELTKEKVDLLKQEIERLKLLVGENTDKAEIEELKSEVANLKKEVKGYKSGQKNDEQIIELTKKSSANDKSLKTMRLNLEAWRKRAFELEQKLEQLTVACSDYLKIKTDA